jgi:hypothetical protein
MRIRHILVCCGLAGTLVSTLSAQNSNQPRVSGTNTAYLSCTFWNGRGWTEKTARSARTPTAESPKGLRAYGEVKITSDGDSCQNTTTLHLSSRVGQAFKIVYTKAPGVSDGNGIRLVGWSPSGDKLLAEVNVWEYDTDRSYGRIAVIYDGSAGTAKEIRNLDPTVSRYFGRNCEYEISLIRWETDDTIILGVSKSLKDDSYEQKFCVNQPRTFVFDFSSSSLLPARP